MDRPEVRVDPVKSQGSSRFHSKSLWYLTQGEVCFGILALCCLCVPSRFGRLLLVSSLVWFLLSWWSSFLVKFGRRWFPDTEKKCWVPGKFRAEKVLENAIMIDGRKEWMKRKNALCAKNKEWYSGSSSSSGGEERWSGGQDEELKKVAGTSRAAW